MNTKRKFKVYCEGIFIGETLAVSALNAISMVRYRESLLYKPMKSFKAEIAYTEGTHEYDRTPVKPVIVNSEPAAHQISFAEFMKQGVN